MKSSYIIKIFLKYFIINTIVISIGCVICIMLYSMYMNKTESLQLRDKIIVWKQYTYDTDSGEKEYMTEFNYNGILLKSIGYSTYTYCQNKIGKKVNATLIKTKYINNPNKKSEYEILKIHTKY